MFWAALLRTHPFSGGGRRPEAGGENLENVNIDFDDLKPLLASVDAARATRGSVASQLVQANAELSAVVRRSAEAANSLHSREEQAALSGLPLPDCAFPEEAEIEKGERHRKILTARVQAIQKSLAECDANIADLMGRIGRAWSKLAEDRECAAIGRFENAGKALGEALCEIIAWRADFRSGRLPKAGPRSWVPSVFVSTINGSGCLVNSQDGILMKRLTGAPGSVFQRIDGLRRKVLAASEGTNTAQAPPDGI